MAAAVRALTMLTRKAFSDLIAAAVAFVLIDRVAAVREVRARLIAPATLLARTGPLPHATDAWAAGGLVRGGSGCAGADEAISRASATATGVNEPSRRAA
jgi:hypothetical protein